MYYDEFETALGKVVTIAKEIGLMIVHIHSAENKDKFALPTGCVRNAEKLSEAKKQILEYLDGKRKNFDLPLCLEGTNFQLRVWSELRKIPYGQTVSYGEIAKRIGVAGASRAVGTACGRNPLAIVIPCHRVIASGGEIGGFASGLDVKRKLLQVEKVEI